MRTPKKVTGESAEGVARAVLRGGEAAVDTERGAVLVQGLLPGERARLVDVARRGGAVRGRVAERSSDSPDRVAPPCTVQATCGGCPLMIWSIDAQREWKRGLVAEAVGLADVTLETGAALAYRRRARLIWSGAKVGYRAARSHDLIEPISCSVLSPSVMRALELVRQELVRQDVFPQTPTTIVVGDGELRLDAVGDDRVTVSVEARLAQTPAAYAACAKLAEKPGIAGVSLRIGDAAPATWGAPLASFAQAHGEINAALVAHVARLAETQDARVLELFAGDGNLTFALAEGAREVLAVERDARAVASGAAKARALGASHVRFVAGDAIALATGRHVDVVVLDPPREGAKDAVAAIAARRPARIVYVSCDTATLARDLHAFATFGYAPDAAVALDMFPQTAHVETVVRLVASRVATGGPAS